MPYRLRGGTKGPNGRLHSHGKKYHRDGCRYLHPVVWKIPETGLGIDDLH